MTDRLENENPRDGESTDGGERPTCPLCGQLTVEKSGIFEGQRKPWYVCAIHGRVERKDTGGGQP